MEKNNAFKKGLKVPYTQEKPERKYRFGEIQLREDKETGRIEIYLEEDITTGPNKNDEAWTEHRYRLKETNINNPQNVIYYTFKVSPSGVAWERDYDSVEDEERYGKIYSIKHVLFDITGEYKTEGEYTLQELKELIEKINREKGKAKYQCAYLACYKNRNKGKRLLEGLHISKGTDGTIECIENDEILIRPVGKGKISISGKEQEETISMKKIDFVWEDIIPNCGRYGLGGFTIEALRKIFEEREAEKKKKEGQEIDE